MEESKSLKLARQAMTENNTEDAKAFYLKVREEEPENGEAKFFYAYCCLYEGKAVEVPSRFSNLCKVLVSSINLVKNAECSKEEQLKTTEQIVEKFVPETWALNRYMNNKNHEQRIGNEYVKVFNYGEIKDVGVNGMRALKELGDAIEKSYPLDAEAKRLAAIAWKEYVSLSQKWYAYAIKGDAEIYAEKIKKIEPSYEMPKKAGCISFANKK